MTTRAPDPRKPWLYRYFGLVMVPLALLAAVTSVVGVRVGIGNTDLKVGDRFGLNVLYVPGIFLATAAVTGVAFQLTVEACGRRGLAWWRGLILALVVVGVIEAGIFWLVVVYMRHFAAGDASYRRQTG